MESLRRMAVAALALLVCFCFAIVYANPRVCLDRVIYHYEPSIISGKIWLTTNSTINILFNLTKSLRTIDLMFNVNMKIHGSTYVPLVNVTTRYCNKTKQIRANSLTRVINKSFFDTTNFPQNCPIPKNQYYVRNYSFPDKLLPMSFPKVGFRTKTKLSFRNDLGEPKELCQFEFFGRITDG